MSNNPHDVRYPPLDEPAFILQAIRERHQREHDTFFVSYGKAIAAWTAVEGAIAQVYLAAHGEPWGSPKSTIVMTAFQRAGTWRAQLEMTDGIVSLYRLPEELSAEWDLIYKKARKLAQTRNSIVHGVIVQAYQAKPGMVYSVTDNFEDATTHSSISGKARYYFHSLELMQVEERFRSFARRVMSWLLHFEHVLGLLPASPAPPSDQTNSDGSTPSTQTLTEPQPPPQSSEG